MKKTFSVLLIVAVSMFLFGGITASFAQSASPLPPPVGPVTVSGWVAILVNVVQWFYTIIFIIAVLFILLAAFNFITSGGDPTKTTAAKKQLLYAVIGIVVALLSYGVVTLVQNSLNSGLRY